MKSIKKYCTSMITILFMTCNVITGSFVNVNAQENIEEQPIEETTQAPTEQTAPVEEVPEASEPVLEEPSLGTQHVEETETSTVEDQPVNEEPEPTEKEQPVPYPAFDREISWEDGKSVQVQAPEGAFPEGVQVNIKKVNSKDILEAIQAQKEIKEENIQAYDFDFYTSEQHNIEPLLPISVTFKGLEIQGNETATLYHLKDVNSPAEKEDIKEVKKDKGNVTFESDSFSIHALVLSEDTTVPAEIENEEVPNEQPVAEAEDPSTSTGSYESSISLAPGSSNAYYGGEIITLYNNITVSGNNTIVPEGSYTVVSLPKQSFQKPRESDISTSFDHFKSFAIRETDTDYQIVLTYKTLYGGYNGGTPVRVNLLSGQTINNTQHTIKQEFYNKEGKKLTPDQTLTVRGKAKIQNFGYINTYSSQRLKESVDSNFVIKEGTFFDFYPNIYSVASNENDPRARRLYASIPQGTKVKENTGWLYEKETDRYYKDIPRDKFTDTSYRTITLDLGGNDLSNYDSSEKPKEFRVDFSVQPVVSGSVQTDLGPYTTYCTRSFYIVKVEKPKGAVPSWYASKFEKIIDKEYRSVDGYTYESTNNYKDTTISYNKEYLYTHRMRYTLKNIAYYTLNNAAKTDEDMRELIIKDARVDLDPYIEPSQIRLMVIGLKEQDAQMMKEKLTGTKAYGITADGTKVLISENVPIHIDTRYDDSFDAEDWQTLENTEKFTKVEFVYPDGGVTLKGQAQIDRCKKAIYSDVIGRVKESTYDTLKNKLDAHQYASVKGGFQYGNTSIVSKYYKFDTDTELTSKAESSSGRWTNDTITMQNEKIDRNHSISITNGSQFFTNDTISTSEAYTHYRSGNFAEVTEPDNLNVYYLVPDGLEPVSNPDKFTSIDIVRGYKDGMNLVIAKPKSVSVPKLDGTINKSTTNYFNLNFTATSRLDIGTYTIYSAMSYDNNKIGIDPNGQQYGILQSDTPSSVWSTLLKDARNRPDDPTKFTSFSSANLTIYPPKVLSALKQVKLSSETDAKYASSLGSKATIGDGIDYRWVLKNNTNAPITTLEILDVLPYAGDHSIVQNDAGEYPNRGSQFKTPLVSMADSDKFDYYYSADPVGQTAQESYNATWSKTVDDFSKVTMIKAVLKEGQSIPVGENAYIVTHNQIENDPKIQDGNKAYNSFAYTLNRGNSFTEALQTEVQVTYPKRDVLVEKVNVEDDAYKLFGAVFNVYEEGTGENRTDRLILSNIATNHDGIATLPNLFIGKEYYLQEVTAPEGYVKSGAKTYFTVKEPESDGDVQKIVIQNDVPRTTMKLSKNWIGAQAVSQVTVHILANGKDTGQTVVLKAADDWKTSVENLPVNDKNGNPLTYSVKEEAGQNYTSSISGDMTDGFVITNTNTETRDILVSKAWVGPKQDSVQVTLVKDGTPTDQTLTLQEENDWQSSFEDLIKYDPTDGHEIAYTIQEDEIEHYTSSVSGDMVNGFVLTNTNTETVSVPVTKVWIGPQQAQAEVTLVKDGSVTDQKLVLNAENAWTASFAGLAKYDDADGHKFVYTVQETPIEHYVSHVTGSMDDGFTITNTNTETVSVPVTKQWIGPMQDAAEVILVKDGADTKSTLVLNAQNGWKDSFENLMKYDRKDGHEIQYQIKETPIENYATNITGDSQNGFVITNTNVHTISIPVQKVWVGPEQDSVEVSLIRDGQDVVQTLNLSKDDQWKSSFNDVPEYDQKDGHAYVYSVQEANVSDYKSVITGTQDTGFTITNTITGKVSIGITKQWIGKAADSITVDLMNGDQKVDSVKLSKENHWQHTFTDLEQYDAKGQAIVYTVREQELDGYASKITGDMNSGYVITNTNISKRDLSITKKWNGDESDFVEVFLYADGQKIQSLKLTAKDNWKHIVSDLPVYSFDDGHLIEYTIEETPIEGYTSEITGNMEEGYVITNTQKPTDVSVAPKDSKDKPNPEKPKDSKTTKNDPDTGTQSGQMTYIVLGVLSVILILALVWFKKRR